MQKILYLGFVWPEPKSSAAGSRTMEFLRIFRQQSWQVIFASAAALSIHRADLAELGIEEKTIAINCDSFDQFVLQYQPDIVVFDRYFTEEQFGWRVEKNCPNALRILDTCDLHSLREARHQLLKASIRFAHNEAERYQIDPIAHTPAELCSVMAESEIAYREIAAIFRCDVSLIISSFEYELLVEHFAVPPTILNLNNLMLLPSTTSCLSFVERAHFMCIGNFRHAPNWDSVLWLKHAIWPRIRAQLPEAQLHVFGAYVPPKATALHRPEQGFFVDGWVEDAHQVMAQARICLAPLRFGAGIKGKLADAMTCGTPSVTTSIGSEGMAGKLAWGGAVHDTADALAHAAINLYQNEDAWLIAQQQGKNILATYFNRDDSAKKFLSDLSQARNQQSERRRANFTGAMLRHHLHKSTQYMSQWIALKNRYIDK